MLSNSVDLHCKSSVGAGALLKMRISEISRMRSLPISLVLSGAGLSPVWAEPSASFEREPLVVVSVIAEDVRRGVLRVDDEAKARVSAAIPAVAKPSIVGVAVRRAATVPAGMPLSRFRVTSRYGWRMHPFNREMNQHSGIDLSATAGSPVQATADGVIRTAGWSGNYGIMVSIDHNAGLETRYAHLSGIAVANGQAIRQGDVVGFVGSTGRSTGPHLHYEVRRFGKALNPAAF